ncbi:hypothetical protein KRE43_05480 [Elizabethkingia meningoseptica]|uniref:hypothetical protein n=1 Tax=Elizabethkingia meningoseptica TaxID=238 RepID=UPI0023B130BC|nr:hypothetical protein [Elizabethkingia meningoseptica]MDE5515138.1 hypothetical protein [Elizabethkingia meningoseptica]MDE5525875.1 hypothetical protein [Elizabethkingia meningoseptica]MDE5529404.1 hypothetical protein [Elizabethkingia meningoseptica]MDE5532960.1 hypothetical protein [Elizabethkingia meningoseptica]MDE5541293.1 hypothetical protein [Elizabethkingia meningoseptica]
MNTIYLNHHFRFVLTYFDIYGKRKRHFVGAGRLSEYIGEKNAETIQKTAFSMKRDKHTVKFRKCGKIEIYSK